MVITTGFGPHEKVITPPFATAATTAADVQPPGVPSPTTVVGSDTSAACAAEGTGACPSGLPGEGSVEPALRVAFAEAEADAEADAVADREVDAVADAGAEGLEVAGSAAALRVASTAAVVCAAEPHPAASAPVSNAQHMTPSAEPRRGRENIARS
jgi:hypothetical protein